MGDSDRRWPAGNRVGGRVEELGRLHTALAQRHRHRILFGGFFMLAFALRTLPVGTAYAVWVGIGAVGVAIVGIVAFGESGSLLRLGFIATILVGVIGLRILEG